MNRTDIKRILPQRDPMLLVDDMSLEGDCSVSRYHVKGDEYFLQGHFPGTPVVPGVILCEIMGQGAAALLQERLDGTVLPVFAGMERVRFKQMARPGDVIESKARLLEVRGNMVFFESKATIDGKLCCSAKLTVALMPNEQ